jgi:type VI secretion system protein ImpA
VIKVSSEALQKKTKDLQIAIWLTEALIKKLGFAGLSDGLAVTKAFINDYWDTLYPLPEEGDLEYRIGPLEFLNDKISSSIKDIPITEPKTTSGYSWHDWQASRQEKGEEGKLSADDFNAAVSKSSRDFYINLARDTDACMEAFSRLDALVDEKFGKDAPRLSELKAAIEDCGRVVNDILTGKGGRPAGPGDETAGQDEAISPPEEDRMAAEPVGTAQSGAGKVSVALGQITDQGDFEAALWKEAQETLKTAGIKSALSKLLGASYTSSSIRQRNRYRLMMANIALQAKRPDIARPILEELYALIGELHLEEWESSIWIAEVIEAYFQCLTAEGSPDEDISRAYGELYPKLCSKDITKALLYKKGG